MILADLEMTLRCLYQLSTLYLKSHITVIDIYLYLPDCMAGVWWKNKNTQFYPLNDLVSA